MISIENQPINHQANDQDFTVEAYRQLISLALTSYRLADYRSIPWGERFVLWRHDCDYSLNRSLALAKIEAEVGLRSTFFVNPHCEFYNLLESRQLALVKEMVQLGHDIGLHFDGAFYNMASEGELNEQVSREADLLERFVGGRPAAFSFHNPSAFHLTCEADTYGGLVNCYSKRFKTEVPYCSDSNGYWRFRRLFDVLSEAKDPCLQVLTHPGWWQEKQMPPRQRIFRSAYGRATATMHLYDQSLTNGGRENLAGKSQAIRFLKSINPKLFDLCDFLWNSGRHQTLYVELWRLHESQINRLCKAVLRKEWGVPARDVNAFFDQDGVAVDGWRLFKGLFGDSWQSSSGQSETTHQSWVTVRNQLVHGRSSVEPAQLELGCVYLCSVIQAMAAWGLTQVSPYDGLSHLGSIGLPTYKSADGSLSERLEEIVGDVPQFPIKRWEVFRANITSNNASTKGQALN